MKLERRFFPTQGLKIEKRALSGQEGGGNAGLLSGHAAVFNQLSLDLGGFREKIMPGAFAASIATDDVRALFNHDPNFVLGRNKASTLRLSEDETGLAFGCDLPDTQFARDLSVSIDRGDISQCSFGFETIDDEWQMQDGETVRTLKAVRLYDVSPVVFPAYPQTDVATRSLQEWRAKQTDPKAAEDMIRRRLKMRTRLAEAS
jgi:HK97 family phage prohead protease